MTYTTTKESQTPATPAETSPPLPAGNDRFLNTAMFVMFFISGFCSLAYQTVWLRLAFASFGVITPVVSVIVSVFMLGLGIGSWFGGKYIGELTRRSGRSALAFYGIAELVIGVGAFAVPLQFYLGKSLLLTLGESDSFAYLFGSALAITASVIVWAIAMGTTFPFGVAFMKDSARSKSHSFSFLYLANVAGAVAGTLATVIFLVECLGFRHTLMAVACLNFSVAAFALLWSRKVVTVERFTSASNADGSGPGGSTGGPATADQTTQAGLAAAQQSPLVGDSGKAAGTGAVAFCKANPGVAYFMLFATGFISMAMEVVWTRAFCKSLGTWVYSFAALLATYLASTFVGSFLYRRDCRDQSGVRVRCKGLLMALVAVSGFLPVLLNDPRLVKFALSGTGSFFVQAQAALALVSIVPFCTLLGYLCPLVIDEACDGDAALTGSAYAVNTAGCILGPLLSGYVLLPWLGAKDALIVLSVLMLGVAVWLFSKFSKTATLKWLPVQLACLAVALFCLNLEEPFVKEKLFIKRDYASTVSSWGKGMHKQLCVNGYSMTALTPVTKYIAHLPVAMHKGKPESILVICFGMGTTFRSMMSWDTDVTAVELAGGVKDSFGYFWDDAGKILANPKGRIVVDDGRRFLTRGKQQFDIVVFDPPPPVEAAGSSLLYSKDFYKVVKAHLKPGGIMQQWFPGGEYQITQAVLRSVKEAFPYVRVFCSPEEPHVNGYHILASLQPIDQLTVDELIAKMPPAARADLAEWEPGADKQAAMRATLAKVLDSEIPVHKMLNADPSIKITDDHPYNEYCVMRRLQASLTTPH